MKVRTITQAARWVKEVDPETALTPTAIRRLVISGEIPSRKVGAKYLLDLDILSEYMAGGQPTNQTEPTPAIGQIRAIR